MMFQNLKKAVSYALTAAMVFGLVAVAPTQVLAAAATTAEITSGCTVLGVKDNALEAKYTFTVELEAGSEGFSALAVDTNAMTYFSSPTPLPTGMKIFTESEIQVGDLSATFYFSQEDADKPTTKTAGLVPLTAIGITDAALEGTGTIATGSVDGKDLIKFNIKDVADAADFGAPHATDVTGADVNVNGNKGTAITPVEAGIELTTANNAGFEKIDKDTDVTGWFFGANALPAGLSVKVKNNVAKGDKVLTLVISGTPTEEFAQKTVKPQIPNSVLVGASNNILPAAVSNGFKVTILGTMPTATTSGSITGNIGDKISKEITVTLGAGATLGTALTKDDYWLNTAGLSPTVGKVNNNIALETDALASSYSVKVAADAKVGDKSFKLLISGLAKTVENDKIVVTIDKTLLDDASVASLGAATTLLTTNNKATIVIRNTGSNNNDSGGGSNNNYNYNYSGSGGSGAALTATPGLVDSSGKSVDFLSAGTKKVVMEIGKSDAVVDGADKQFGADYGSPYVDGSGNTMIPVRLFSEAVGCTVSYDYNSKNITITDVNGNKLILNLYSSSIKDGNGNVVGTLKDAAGNSVTPYFNSELNRIFLPYRAVLEGLFGAATSEITLNDGVLTFESTGTSTTSSSSDSSSASLGTGE